MSDFNNDDLFEGFEEETPQQQPAGGPERKSGGGNRTFVTVLGIIALVFVLAIIGVIVTATVIMPQRNAARMQQAAEINAQNTLTAMAATNQAFDIAQTLSAPTATVMPSATSQPSPTFVVVFASETPTATEAVGGAGTQAPGAAAAPNELLSRTQTVAALLTQAAQGLPTQAAAPGTTTALPTTGFADEVGLPGMLGLAVLLVGVIFLARRLRAAGG